MGRRGIADASRASARGVGPGCVRGAEIRARPPPSWESDANVEPDRRQVAPNSASRSGRERRLDDRRGDRRADTNAPVDPRRLARRVAYPSDAAASRRRGTPRRATRPHAVFSTCGWRHTTVDRDSLRRTRATLNATDLTRITFAERDGAPVPSASDASRARDSPDRERRAAVFARVPLRRDRRSRAVFVHFSAVPVKTARRVRGNPRATPARRALVPRRCATQRTLASVDRDASARGKRTSHSRPLLARSLVRPPEPN